MAKEIERMFAKESLDADTIQQRDQRVKRHFVGRQYRHLDWSREAVLVVMFAFVLGGAAKTLVLPFLAILATLAVSAMYLSAGDEPSPNAWLAQLSLLTTATFYAGLGYCFGWVALLLIPGLFVVRALGQLKNS